MFKWNGVTNQGIIAQELGQVLNDWVRSSQSNDTPAESSDITFDTGGGAPSEMLRVAPDGFYVRGQRVPVDAREAETVYRAFREWLTWAHLSRE